MPSRAELELRAAPLNVTAANFPNDSNLEQEVLYQEKAMTAQAAAATTQAPAARAIAQTAGGKDL